MTSTHHRTVNCPTCQQEVAWTEQSVYRPFCSKRCKLIDFGDWAAERHTIPGKPVFPEADDPEKEKIQ